MQETLVQPPAQEDPLENGMTNCSSTLAWETPWTAELGGLQSMGLQRVGHNEATKNNTKYIIFMRNAGLDEAQAGIKIAGININISDMQMTPPLW